MNANKARWTSTRACSAQSSRSGALAPSNRCAQPALRESPPAVSELTRQPPGNRGFVAGDQRANHNARTVTQDHPLGIRARSRVADPLRNRCDLCSRGRQHRLGFLSYAHGTPHLTGMSSMRIDLRCRPGFFCVVGRCAKDEGIRQRQAQAQSAPCVRMPAAVGLPGLRLQTGTPE